MYHVASLICFNRLKQNKQQLHLAPSLNGAFWAWNYDVNCAALYLAVILKAGALESRRVIFAWNDYQLMWIANVPNELFIKGHSDGTDLRCVNSEIQVDNNYYVSWIGFCFWLLSALLNFVELSLAQVAFCTSISLYGIICWFPSNNQIRAEHAS